MSSFLLIGVLMVVHGASDARDVSTRCEPADTVAV